jgi:hypothetical protein
LNNQILMLPELEHIIDNEPSFVALLILLHEPPAE